MSAIAGIWRFDGKPGVEADCARMLASQEIYGPHDGRTWSDGALAMGRRLYRTLPEDIHDRQPLQSRQMPVARANIYRTRATAQTNQTLKRSKYDC